MKDHHKTSLEIIDDIMSTPEGRAEVLKITKGVETLGIEGPTYDEYLQELNDQLVDFQENLGKQK